MKSRIFLPILFFGIIIGSDCKKSKHSDRTEKRDKSESTSDRYVSSESGLFLREEPSVKGKSIVLIPQGAKVKVLEEESETVTISGATGKWTKVKYRGEKGWAFGGFLVRKMIDKNQMQHIEYMETTVSRFKSEEEKKKFLEALNAFKEALYNSDGSKLDKLEQAYQKARKLEKNDGTREPESYAVGDLVFETCMSLQKAKNCTDKSLKPKQFSKAEDAVNLLKKSISEKNAKLLTEATGCMLNVGCYSCDGGPSYALAEPAIKELFSKDLLSGNTEYRINDDTMKVIGIGDLEIVISREENGKWEMDHIRNGADPICWGPGA